MISIGELKFGFFRLIPFLFLVGVLCMAMALRSSGGHINVIVSFSWLVCGVNCDVKEACKIFSHCF